MIGARLRVLLMGTLRRQLTLGMAVVVVVTMLLLVLNFTLRERAELSERQEVVSQGIARALATAAASGLAARDLAGLQELVEAQRNLPQLDYAMLLDTQGRVLAHTDRSRIGQYVQDLPPSGQALRLDHLSDRVDVTGLAQLSGQAVGWSRVGLSSREAEAELADVSRSGALHAVAAAALASLIAALIGRWFTRRLSAIQAAADAVNRGDETRRAPADGGDEAAHLARAFNRMLDSLATSRAAQVASEQRLLLALDAAAMATWRWDIATDRMVWSDGQARLLGPAPADGYPDVREMVLPQDRVAYLAAYQVALQRGGDYVAEFRLRRTDAAVRWLSVRGRLQRDDQGAPLALLGVAQDITERKALEAELIQHRDHLEDLVDERTAELDQARREAERLARAKSEFLANMSHEIRTPLNAVLGLAQLGQRDHAAAGAGETFGRIREAGDHLLSVINDVLDFSRLEAGKLAVEQRPFSLARTVTRVDRLMAGAVQLKGLRYTTVLSPALPDRVLGDARRLEQILVNLLGNAIKFTERGEVTLRVTRDGEAMRFEVSDTGIGMTESQRLRLFQPFEQGDGSTTRRFGGSGLGLAISRDLARLMGGDIEAVSQAGQGSAFTLQLPLPEAPPEAAAEPTAEPATSTAAAASGARLAGLHLLAAEDLEVNRIILEALLGYEGAQVSFAEDGQQAVDRVADRPTPPFDAVLMDIQMPVMDGYEAARQIHALAPDLPVIGLTAHALSEEREKCRAVGMVGHVTKPIDLEELVAAILARQPPA